LLLCDALERVLCGACKRLMVMMPPGSAKSTYATIRFPAYFLGRMGAKGIVSASYDDSLATNFGRQVRNLVRTPEYQSIFPHVHLSVDSKAKGEWATAEGGFYFATGVEGGINGRRGALGMLDDIVKGRMAADSETTRENTWQWYINDFRSRLWPDAPIVYIGTRWHMDDPAGRILPDDWNGESGTITAKDGEVWEVICLPAEAREGDPLGREPGQWLWTEWFNEAYWEQTKRTALLNDVRNWNALYQQVPTDDAGTYFQRQWFDDTYTTRPEALNVYMSGDFAVTDGAGDFTELAVWGIDSRDDVYVLDWWSGQTTSDVWITALIQLAKKWDAHTFIGEMGPIRRAVEPFLEHTLRESRHPLRIEWLASAGNKEASARTFQALSAMKRVHFPNTEWAGRVISQLCKFPAGKHDDCVDASALFARFLASTWGAVPKAITTKPVLSETAWNALPKIAEFFKPKLKERW
jgi:predicted phage terminase large subunit-like protein